jgi:DNA-binding LacI/PurR family transcriptional regulator
MATRNDVAKKAGVSSAVVSYVLNGSNYVSEEKRKAVLKAVEELEYSPNYLARSLKTKRSFHFALVGDDIHNELFAELVYYMEQFSYSSGYCISLCSSRDSEDFIPMLISRHFDGIFMTSNAFSAQQLNLIAAANIPMVLFQTRAYEGLDTRIVVVAPNFYDGIRKSMEYLVLKGHQRIALLPPVMYKANGISDKNVRMQAYVETLNKYDIPIDESLICFNTKSVDSILDCVFHMMTVPDKTLKPTAFVVGNDYLAAQCIKYLQKLNLRVPEDVAIIGSDNTFCASITTPTITTIDIPKQALAKRVVDTLIQIIHGQQTKHCYLDVNLIFREST